jgi:outer membrane protein assembly factor BamD (BamD/ComL family)
VILEGMRRCLWSLFLLHCLVTGFLGAGVLPLREAWEAACRNLQEGEVARACQHFEAFEKWFGQEPESQEAAFNERRIRLWALAALQAGQTHQGIELLQRWFSENPNADRFRAYLRFQLASACQSIDLPDAARRHWRAFIQEHALLPECALAHWALADIALKEKDVQGALDQLQAAARLPSLDPVSQSLLASACAALHLALNQPDKALQDLAGNSDKDCETAKVIRSLWRGALAPRLIAQQLGEHPEATRISQQWLRHPDDLQQSFLRLEASLSRLDALSMREQLWQSNANERLKAVTRLIDPTPEGTDPLCLLYELRLQSLLQTQQFSDAAILGEALAADLAPDDTSPYAARLVATQIKAAHGMEDWAQAEILAARFLEVFSQCPEAANLSFLNARTAALQGRFENACTQLSALIQSWPDHPRKLSWQFMRARWLLSAGHPHEALEQLQTMTENIPPAWVPMIAFQEGLCHVALKEEGSAWSLFQKLVEADSTPLDLAEAASFERLKLSFAGFAPDRMEFLFEDHRTRFPEGRLKAASHCLAAAWQAARGMREAALAAYGIAAEESNSPHFSEASLGIAQLLPGPPQINRIQHLESWFGRALENELSLPQAALDLLRNCHAQGQALSHGFVARLPALLEEAPGGLARTLFPPVIDAWPLYADNFAGPEADLHQWLHQRRNSSLQSGHHTASVAWQLIEAAWLESNNRKASADARRIEVLQSTAMELLSPLDQAAIALTAATYNFPEADRLLEQFCLRFPKNENCPQILLCRGRIAEQSEFPDKALIHWRTLLQQWPESPAAVIALYALAHYNLTEGSIEEAHHLNSRLLQRTDLTPEQSAQALLLRIRIDLKNQQYERARINCQRLQCLYPAFPKLVEAARNLENSLSKST